PVVRSHRDAERRGDRLLAEREVARAFDEVLQEEIVGALLAVTQFELESVELEANLAPDVVAIHRRGGFLSFGFRFQIHPQIKFHRRDAEIAEKCDLGPSPPTVMATSISLVRCEIYCS